MRLTEEQLRKAAIQAQKLELANLPDAKTCPRYEASADFEQYVEELMHQLEQGNLQPDAVRMGWQYYTKRSAAAVLICFGLACATMPETVLAACQRIIDIVENVLEEYTEFRFKSSAQDERQFTPAILNYLPEDMKQVRYREFSNGVVIRYEGQKNYFSLEQTLVNSNNDVVYILDTEDAQVEKINDGEKEITIIFKNNLYQYVMLCDFYTVIGETNLTYEELLKILQNIIIEF